MPEENKDKQGGQEEVTKPAVGATSTPVNFFAQRSGLMTDNYTVGTTTLDGRAITNEIPLPPTPATNPAIVSQESTAQIIENLKELGKLRVHFAELKKDIDVFNIEAIEGFENGEVEDVNAKIKKINEIITEIDSKETPPTEDDLLGLSICIQSLETLFLFIKSSYKEVDEVVTQADVTGVASVIKPTVETGAQIDPEKEKAELLERVEGLKVEFEFESRCDEADNLLGQIEDPEFSGELRAITERAKSELASVEQTPTKENVDSFESLLIDFNNTVASGQDFLKAEMRAKARYQAQLASQPTASAPSPAPATTSSPTPGTTSPDNRATSIESDLGLTNDQLFLTQPENIVRIEDSDKWMLVSPNGDSRHLEKDEESIWRMCQEEFARYEKYINEKTNSELLKQYLLLIEAKMDLIDVLEKRGLRAAWSAGHAFSLLLDKAERGELLEAVTPSAPSQATPIAQSNPTTPPSSPEQYTSEQIYVTKPGNIYYDENFVRKGGAIRAKGKSKGAWVINGYGKKSFNPKPLHSGDYMEWKNCMFELERYTTFINQVPKEELKNYTQLIEAKINLIKTLQEKGFEHAREFGEKLNEILNRAVSGEFDKPEPAVKDISVEKNSVLEKISLTITPDKNDPFYQEQELCGELIRSYNEYVDKISAVFRTQEYQKMFLRDLIENKNNFVAALEELAVGKIKATRQAFGESLLFWSNEYQTVWNEYISITTKLNERGIVADVAFSQSSKGGYNWHVDMKENGSTTFPYGTSVSDKKYWRKIEGDFLNPEKADDIHLAKISLKETSGKKIWYFKNEKGEEVELTKENGLSQEECSQMVSLLSALKNYLKSNEVKHASDSEIKLKKELIDCLNEGKFDEAKKVSEELRARLYGGVVTVKHPHWDPVTQQKVYVETKHKFDGMVKIFEDEAKKNTESERSMLENLSKGYTLTPYGTEFAYFKYPLFSKEGTFVADRSSGKWMKLSEEDINYFSRANSAITRFKLDKPTMTGFITLKNKVIQLVNDYKFKEAADAAHEYLRLSKLPADQLPPDFDKTIFTGTLGSVTSVPSWSPSLATASGGAGGTPPVPPPPAGPPSGPPAPPTPPSGPAGPTSPASPDREPTRLDVAGGWPVTIFRKEIGATKGTRGRIEWYRVEADGKETRLQNSNEWNVFHEEFSLDFKNYADLMLTGRAKERLKKEELYQSLLLVKKNLIDAIKNADLDTAISLLKVFTTELIDAEENWEKTKPKLQEEAKLLEGNAKARELALKDFEGREVWCGKYLARINTIDSQLEQTSLDRDFLNRRRNYVNDLFKKTKELFSVGEFDNKAYTTFVTTLDALEKDDQLSKLENKIAHINPLKAVSASPIPGVVAGQQKVLRTRGRAPITVDQWNREQVDAQAAKEAKKATDSDVNRLETGIAKYSAAKYSEYHQDPVGFVVKHLDDRWTNILTKEEKAVVEGILAKVPDDVLMEARAEARTANKLARDRTAAGMTRQVFSPMTTDKKEDKRMLQEIEAEKKLTDEEVKARRTEDNEKGRPIDASQTDPGYATLTGRMVNSANSPLENNGGARATAVNNVLNKNVARSKGVWWRILGGALFGTAVALGGSAYLNRGTEATAGNQAPGASVPGVNLDQTRQAPNTLTVTPSAQYSKPVGWRDYLTKENAPEFRRQILKDFEAMSTEEFLVEYLPSLVSISNPSSIKKILDLDAYTVRSGQDPLPDISDSDRKILADIISEIQQLYLGTQAPILAGDAKGEVDTSAYYINQPSYSNKKITIGDYFTMFKAAKYAADTRDQAQLGKK